MTYAMTIDQPNKSRIGNLEMCVGLRSNEAVFGQRKSGYIKVIELSAYQLSEITAMDNGIGWQ